MADENTVGSVNVEVRADLAQYQADLARGQVLAQGFAKAVSNESLAAGAATANLTAVQRAQVAQLVQSNVSVAQATAMLGAESVAVKALSGYTTQLAAIERAAAEAATAHAAASSAAAAAITAQTTATKAAGAAAQGAHIQLSTLIREIGVIGREGARGNFNRLAGSATILAQAAGLLTPAVIGTTAAIAGIVGTVIAATVATLQYEAALHQAEITAVGLGDASGISATQISAAASAAAAGYSMTTGTAQKAAEAFSAVTMAGPDAIQTVQGMTESVEAYAKLTGEKAPEAIKKLAAALADPAKGAAELNSQFHFLDATELNNIETLQRLGDKTDAQNLLMKDFKGYADQANVAAGGLAGGLDALASGASRAWQWFGSLEQSINAFWAALDRRNPEVKAAQDATTHAQAGIQSRAELAATEQAAQADIGTTPEVRDQQRRQDLAGAVNRVKADQDAARRAGDTAEYKRATAALLDYSQAYRSFQGEAEKAHNLAVLDDKLAVARHGHNKALIDDLAQQRAVVAQAGEVRSPGEVAQRAADSGELRSDRSGGGRTRTPRADVVAEETTKIKANTAALLAEADAYLKADGASAMRDAAHKQAADYGATHPKANVGTVEGLFLSQDVAQQAAEGAKKLEALRDQTTAEHALNIEVMAGQLPAKDLESRLREEAELRPYIVAQTLAEGDAKAKLTTIINGLRAAQAASNAEADHARINAETDEAVKKALEGAGKPQEFLTKQTESVTAQIAALHAQGATYGMTSAQAASYLETQKLLDDATREGLTLTPQQIAQLHALGDAYGAAKTQADQLAESEKGAQEAAKTAADGIKGLLDAELFPTGKKRPSLGAELKKLGRSQLEDAFNSELTGEGGYAGILGTNQSRGPGQGNKSLLGGPLGSLFGAAAHAKKPDGTAADPLHVIMAGAAASFGAGSGIGSTALSGIKGFSIPGMSGSADGSPFGSIAGLNGFGASAMNPGALAKIGQSFGASGGQSGGILSSIMSLFGSGGGGAAGGGAASAAASIPDLMAAIPFHSGTPYAVNGPGRSVPASVFTDAPRLHTGLAPHEFPAILEHGEAVIPKGGQMGGSRNVNINLAGANGDATIRQISAAGVQRGLQEYRRANPGDTNRHHLLEG